MQRFDTTPPQFGPGMVTFWRDEQLPTMSEWNGVADRDDNESLLSMLTVQRAGASTRTTVNQLMAVEQDWLLPPGDTPGPGSPALSARGL